MGSTSNSSLALPSGQTLNLPLGSSVQKILAQSTASEVARMITEAALKAEQDKADRLLARKLKRRLADINSGKRIARPWSEVKADLAL